MLTKWGRSLDRLAPLPEYPRPQLRREAWLNLNGVWQYAFTRTAAEEQPPAKWDGEIVVPFSPEAELSGVKRTLLPGETLWYQRRFSFAGRGLLHFGAVDQEATVFLNGQELGTHMGGYNAFSFPFDGRGENLLVVRVHDDTDASWHTRGKQRLVPGGIWYTPQSGVWQTVWAEPVPENYIERLEILPLVDEESVRLTVHANQTGECAVSFAGRSFSCQSNQPATLPVPAMRLWSPDDPYLYDLTVNFGSDKVQSYFAMRKTEVRADEKGVKRLFLNNKPLFHNGLLDQGYWPDGLYTPPSDEAMIFDIQTAKSLGYNMLRKHIKVEPMRWYYHCDRLGMLVWQDMPNGGERYRASAISFPLVTGVHHKDCHYRRFARASAKGREEYRRELSEMILQLQSVPSIVLWVPFNEGWGQFDAKEAVAQIRRLDTSRPIDHASGWHDQKIGDVKSLHVYFKPYRFRGDKQGRAVALTEFGGYALPVKDRCWKADSFGYKRLKDGKALWLAYERLYREQILPVIGKGLCAAVYTQLTDVEGEVNGILTYDRQVVKLPAEKLRKLNEELLKSPH